MRTPIGFLVWNPSRSFPTVQHDTYTRAAREAERLTRENPGERFVVMAPVTTGRAQAQAEAFSDGKEEGYQQARAEVMLAEGRNDAAQDEARRLRHEVAEFSLLRGEASEHQAAVADCLLWFDGFNAAHAHKEDWERPKTPDRERIRRLNAALQRILPGQPLDDEEIPF